MADGGPSAVVVTVDSGSDVTLVDSTAEAVTTETVYRYCAASCIDNHCSIFNDGRRNTARIYSNSAHQL